MQQPEKESSTITLKPYNPDVSNSFTDGEFTFSKLIALLAVLIYALVYNILCTPLGWIGIIISAIGYKLIAK
jgi:hypothetical protein